MSEKDARGRGFLTEENREFLRGEMDDASRQAQSHHRTSIRERLRNALLDFTIVFNQMDESELQEVLGDHSFPYRNNWKDDEIAAGMRDTLAFVLREAGIGAELSVAAARSDVAYKELLYKSLRRVGEQQDRVVHKANIEAEASQVDIDQLKHRLETEGREALTFAEIGVLASESELPDDF